jgi:hypothetical protein
MRARGSHAAALPAVPARSRAGRRQRPGPATGRATTHLRGSTAQPLAVSARCTIGRLRCPRERRASGGIALFRPRMAAVREAGTQGRGLAAPPGKAPRRACATGTRLSAANRPLSRPRQKYRPVGTGGNARGRKGHAQPDAAMTWIGFRIRRRSTRRGRPSRSGPGRSGRTTAGLPPSDRRDRARSSDHAALACVRFRPSRSPFSDATE